MARWLLTLRGDSADIETLQRTLPAGFALTELQGKPAFRSDELDAVGDVLMVERRGQEFLAIFNGWLLLHDENAKHIELDTVHEVNPITGAINTFILPATATLTLRVFQPTVVISGGEPVDPAATSAALGVVLADSRAIRAVRFFEEGTWVSLYKVKEIVTEAVGSPQLLKDRGWVSAGALKRFDHTANNANALGDQARHARTSRQGPQTPMTLGEARQLIQGLLLAWLAEISGGS
ncbi:MAG: hypothetical protein ABIQ47_14235 [Tepidiformaceae bacterium]